MITDRKNQVEVLRQENAALEAKLREAQSEQYTERVARDKLGLVREGERVVIVPKSEIINPNDQLPTAELPRWRQWWGLFF